MKKYIKFFVVFYIQLIVIVTIYLCLNFINEDKNSKVSRLVKTNEFAETRINYPFIFIVGAPGSGTTLMKTILDVSSKLKCGHETQLMPSMIKQIIDYKDAYKNDESLKEYIIKIDKAFSLFIIELISKNNHTLEKFCVKDSANIKYISYLHKLFPNSKFIFMIRDGRSSAISRLRRLKMTISEDNFYYYFNIWNHVNQIGYDQCIDIGLKNCLLVKYEDIINEPEFLIKNVFKYLNIEFKLDILRKNEDIANILAGKMKKEALKPWINVINYNRTYVENKFKMMKEFHYDFD